MIRIIYQDYMHDYKSWVIAQSLNKLIMLTLATFCNTLVLYPQLYWSIY